MQRYFLDTNYLLRLLLEDNNDQLSKVKNFFNEAVDRKLELFTSDLVFFEVKWVLTSFYHLDKPACLEYLKALLEMEVIKFEKRKILIQALDLFEKSSLDLEDCYNLFYSKQYSNSEFMTFDKKLLKYC